MDDALGGSYQHECEFCGAPLAGREWVSILDMMLHRDCADQLARVLAGVESSSHPGSPRILTGVADGLRGGEHIGVEYGKDEKQRKEMIAGYVSSALRQNLSVLLLTTKKNAERYVTHMRDDSDTAEIEEVDRLISSRQIIIEPVDRLLEEKSCQRTIDFVSHILQSNQEDATQRSKAGLFIVEEICGSLAGSKRYDDCTTLEKYWHLALAISEFPVTLLHGYEEVPQEMSGPLKELHS